MTPPTVALIRERLDVAYARVSDDDRGAAEGVDSQHEEIEEDGEEAGRPIGARYTDNSISAWNGSERADYQRLLRDAAQDRVASVRVTAADRLCRDVREGLDLVDVFNAHEVRLFSVARGEYNLRRAQGRADFIADINIANKESGIKSERVALARKRQARTGAYGGGIRRFGWGVPTGRVRSKCLNPKAPLDEREYVDVPVLDMGKHRPDEAKEIRRWAKELLATRGNMAQLLASINARGVLTVSQADGRTLKRGGKKVEHGGWQQKTVRRILIAPRVSGHAVNNGQIIKWNAWPAIIPEETRQALITLLEDPARVTSPGNTPKWLISKSRGAECGQCDKGGMVTVRHNSKGAVYRCNTCHKGNQLAELVDEYVGAVACERLSRPDLVELITPPRPDIDVAALREEITGLQQQKTEASLSYARRSIDLEMLETVKAESDRQISVIRSQLAEAISDSPLADFLGAATVEGAAKLWTAKSIGQRREIVRLLMNVVVLKGDPYRLDPDTLLITPRRTAQDVSPA
ncbi:recombinase family protein [Streptomyces sp. NPDC091280]|uniref:recombinase family protein n=1 Tax=Streptomyces sp. NPDC091280 TaxID=3365984 RepID=UPI00381FB445